MKKRLFSFFTLAIALCFLFLPGTADAASSYEWKLNTDTLELQWVNTVTGKPVRSKFMKIDGKTYYFDKNGIAATGWKKIKGNWYYFDSSAAMVTDTWISGHYLRANGRMAVKRWVTDEDGLKVYVGADGTVIQNYKKSRKAKMKTTAKGTRFRQADGTYAKSQWIKWKGFWYYFYSDGYMAKKAFIGRHYVDKNGRMVTSTTKKIGKYRYTFNAAGEIEKKVKVKKTK